jgi:GntR family transcriptional regulator
VPSDVLDAAFSFRLDRASATPPYSQLVTQVRDAIRLGWLRAGDRLPSVREVAATGVNANTVLKAYRELELLGLIDAKQGAGCFVAQDVAQPDVRLVVKFRAQLHRWSRAARAAGLSHDDVIALLSSAMASSDVGEEAVG